MHPDASPFIPVPVVADLHSRLPDARLKVFAHAKHGYHFHMRAYVLRLFGIFSLRSNDTQGHSSSTVNPSSMKLQDLPWPSGLTIR